MSRLLRTSEAVHIYWSLALRTNSISFLCCIVGFLYRFIYMYVSASTHSSSSIDADAAFEWVIFLVLPLNAHLGILDTADIPVIFEIESELPIYPVLYVILSCVRRTCQTNRRAALKNGTWLLPREIFGGVWLLYDCVASRPSKSLMATFWVYILSPVEHTSFLISFVSPLPDGLWFKAIKPSLSALHNHAILRADDIWIWGQFWQSFCVQDILSARFWYFMSISILHCWRRWNKFWKSFSKMSAKFCAFGWKFTRVVKQRIKALITLKVYSVTSSRRACAPCFGARQNFNCNQSEM